MSCHLQHPSVLNHHLGEALVKSLIQCRVRVWLFLKCHIFNIFVHWKLHQTPPNQYQQHQKTICNHVARLHGLRIWWPILDFLRHTTNIGGRLTYIQAPSPLFARGSCSPCKFLESTSQSGSWPRTEAEEKHEKHLTHYSTPVLWTRNRVALVLPAHDLLGEAAGTDTITWGVGCRQWLSKFVNVVNEHKSLSMGQAMLRSALPVFLAFSVLKCGSCRSKKALLKT